MQLLVGPDGRVWQPYSYSFLKYVGYFGGDVDIVAYAIRNLGFALLQRRPRYAKIVIQPSNFPRPCLEKLIEMILQQEDRQFVIERGSLSPRPIEVIGNVNDTLARLRTLQAESLDEAPAMAPSFINLDLARLDHPKRRHLKVAFSVWREAKGQTTTEQAVMMPSDPILGGGMMAWLPRKDRCIVQSWPKTYDSYDDSAESANIGRDLIDLPDPDYILPTTRVYFTVADQQAPRLELIEAMMTATDGSRYWVRYERLLLSWRTRSTDRYVSSIPLVRMVRPF